MEKARPLGWIETLKLMIEAKRDAMRMRA